MDQSSAPVKLKRSAELPHRSDIDGLRAVAVLIVPPLTSTPSMITGGFIGVDVFFVISGYLISSAILKEISRGALFPSSTFTNAASAASSPRWIVMLLGTCALACRFLFPTEMVDFAKSLLAATFSVSELLVLAPAGLFRCAERPQAAAAYLVARR